MQRQRSGTLAGLVAVSDDGEPIDVPPRPVHAFGAGQKFHRRQPPVLAARSVAQLLAQLDDAHAGLGPGLGGRAAEHDADKIWLRLLVLALQRPRASGVLGRDLAWFDQPQATLSGSTPFEAARDVPRFYALLGRLILNGGREPSKEDRALLAEQRALAGTDDALVRRALVALAPRCHYSPFLVGIYLTLLRLPGEGGTTLYRLAARGDAEALARALLDHFDATLPPSVEAGGAEEPAAAVIGQSVDRIAAAWQLTEGELLAIIHMPAANLGICGPEHPALRRAKLLIALFTELGQLLGSDDVSVRSWLRAANVHLGGVAPIDVMQAPDGLERVMLHAGRRRSAPS